MRRGAHASYFLTMARESEQPKINPWIIATAVMLSTFMEVLDTTVVNVSLPHIAGSMSASVDEATWTLTSYLVANAIILPITGWLSNYFGRKRVLMTSVTGFTIASFLCGLAPNLPLLVFFRIIQGACGGGLQPISQAVLLESFPPEDRGKAMGFWGLGIVVAPMLGPVLGGWLTDSYSWRWVFYINIPVGILALIMTQLFVFDPSYIKRATSRIDYWGIGMLAVGVGALQIILDKGQEKDWFSSHFITRLAAISAIALVAFVVYELVVAHPVVDLRAFKERTYSAGVFLMTVLGFVLYGSLVILPIFLQTILGYPALQAGVAMFPRGLGSFIAMPFVGLIMARYDPRKLLIIGLVACSISLVMLGTLSLNVGYWEIFWAQFLQGLSLGFLFVPLTTVTMDRIPNEKMGNATSIFNLMRNIGGSMGIALSTTIVARSEQKYTNFLGRNVTPYSPQTQTMIQGLRSFFMSSGADAATASQRAHAALFGMVQRQSAMLSFNHTYLFLAILFVAVMPAVFLMRRPKRRGGMPVH
ncbi:MAG TPA: DHA2 family efflux MFS transporter permease subunit [Terriglobia bacterium]|nr:DHA2 family efflux MFS transporter permease subunit [Terriglobia bacterium]